jgi:hypothetical protein
LEVADHHEPLITQELWEAVQKIFESHPLHKKKGSLHHPRRVGNPTILSGFTYCIECGAMMTHSPGHKRNRWPHYICGRKDRHGIAACGSRRIGAGNAEQQILTAVLDQVLTPEYLTEAIAETKKRLDATPEMERQITAAKRRLEELEIAIQRALNTIEKTGSPAAQDRLQQREAEKIQTRDELKQLELQLATARTEITPEAIGIILAAWRAQFDQLQESGNVREIKAWLLQFVSKIEVGYNRARIFYTYPMMDLFSTGGNSRNALAGLGGINKKESIWTLFY